MYCTCIGPISDGEYTVVFLYARVRYSLPFSIGLPPSDGRITWAAKDTSNDLSENGVLIRVQAHRLDTTIDPATTLTTLSYQEPTPYFTPLHNDIPDVFRPFRLLAFYC